MPILQPLNPTFSRITPPGVPESLIVKRIYVTSFPLEHNIEKYGGQWLHWLLTFKFERTSTNGSKEVG